MDLNISRALKELNAIAENDFISLSSACARLSDSAEMAGRGNGRACNRVQRKLVLQPAMPLNGMLFSSIKKQHDLQV